MSFNPKFFTQVPAENVLEVELDNYNEIYGTLIRKVGICNINALAKRYSNTCKFKQLDEKSIFAKTSDWRVAFGIETLMKEILKKRGISGNNLIDFNLGSVNENLQYYVYLTELKNEDSKCPLCENIYIDDKNGRNLHRVHKHKQLLKEIKSSLAAYKTNGGTDQTLISELSAVLQYFDMK
ncbi:hypothetical protein PVAND_013073 [Polypedilum vanderplanki]|uniref:Uncharacterized protein n=1 Tax=Polypedilum vanderplanki TaxID=319348 RepID=A0A9J6CNJ3_POLVA|nr:hypothetical protein PVAND_013073 [Polypedilum vanderplanki]